MTKSDAEVCSCGSVTLIACYSEAAREWANENLELESWQWSGLAFACEPRYVDNLVQDMRDHGLEVT